MAMLRRWWMLRINSASRQRFTSAAALGGRRSRHAMGLPLWCKPQPRKRPEATTMMRAKTEQKVKRWKDQRWLIDSVIQAVGMEWDQPRLNYTMYPAGPDAIGDFRTVGTRVRKFADMHREFAAAAHRRDVKAVNFEKQGRKISARESYFIASLLYSAARWPIFESNAKSIDYNARMVACYDKFAALMNRPVIRVEVPYGGKTLPGYLHLPREPKPGEKFPCAIGIDGMDGSKEIMCSMYGDKFLERGMAHFIYDG